MTRRRRRTFTTMNRVLSAKCHSTACLDVNASMSATVLAMVTVRQCGVEQKERPHVINPAFVVWHGQIRISPQDPSI